MLLAVFSDTHDNMDNIQKALAIAGERGIENGIHLGDFCAPPSLVLLAQSGIKWKCVWGNVDGDRLMGARAVEEYGTVDIVTTDFRELQVENRKIFLTHYPEIARIAALSGQFSAVFFGHNHIASQEMIHNIDHETLLANPGEIAGFRYGAPSFGIYNTENNSFEHVQILASASVAEPDLD